LAASRSRVSDFFIGDEKLRFTKATEKKLSQSELEANNLEKSLLKTEKVLAAIQSEDFKFQIETMQKQMELAASKATELGLGLGLGLAKITALSFMKVWSLYRPVLVQSCRNTMPSVRPSTNTSRIRRG
jgi:hypothetical protein